MGFLSNLFGRSDADADDEEYEEEYDEDEEEGPARPGTLPTITTGMKLTVETQEGVEVLTGRVSSYSGASGKMTLERVPGGLSFKTLEIGTTVQLRGYDEKMSQFILKAVVQESSRLICKLKDVKLKPIPDVRENFRLRLSTPASLFLPSDMARSNPEECTLVDISTGGACLESEYLHAEDEVLRLKVKLEDYVPMEFVGEIIRVVEYRPGKFRYGFLFAQLEDTELTELTRTLYNIQTGNKVPWARRSGDKW